MERKQHSEKAGGPVPLAGRSPGAFVFASAIGPRIMFSPPDDGGSGAPASVAAGTGSEKDAGSDNGGPAAGDGGGQDSKPVRPDYLPESYWDAEKGFKSDDFNSLVAFKAEHDANLAQVPEKADGYKIALPKDFKIEGLELKDGESPIDESDPRISFARDFALSRNMSQSDFESLIALGVQMDVAQDAKLQEALQVEVTALGSKGKERVNAITTWIGAKLGGEAAQALAPMLFTAKQIEAFEGLMRLNRGAVPGNPGAGRDAGKPDVSDEEWARMSPSERIHWSRQNSKKVTA
jgi:hypothetical protein